MERPLPGLCADPAAWSSRTKDQTRLTIQASVVSQGPVAGSLTDGGAETFGWGTLRVFKAWAPRGSTCSGWILAISNSGVGRALRMFAGTPNVSVSSGLNSP